MGRAKTCVDEGDIPDSLAMKGDVLQNREDTTELKGDMEDLRKDVHAIHLKQDAMAKVVTGVQAAISVLNQQLATMADVLKSFGLNRAPPSVPPGQNQKAPATEAPQTSTEAPKQDTTTRPLTEELRKRLAVEQEKTKQFALQMPPN